MINYVGHRKIFYCISGLLVIVAIAAICLWGFRLGIDFRSGSLWEVKIPDTNIQGVKDFFASTLHQDVQTVAFDSKSGTYSITTDVITEATRQQYLSQLETSFGSGVQDVSFATVSPTVSSQLGQEAIIAIVLVLVFISLYVAFAFRKVSQPVSSWKYGTLTLTTLFHDVVIPAGLYAVLGRFLGVTADSNFLVALLVVMGFSVHDTIVVFDRVRENLVKYRGREEFGAIVNRSVNETMRRSLSTSFTLILVLLAIYLLGPLSLRYFVLTILVGTTVGAYSSIFIASPMLVTWNNLGKGKTKRS
ncbi:protein translocase subunit SecF [Patescibacteria group bacterium]|nr:protein translocase subunit SecF [Patescibacteria group bacterium]